MNSLAEALKSYLEKQIKEDTALADVYDEKKLEECAKYVTDQARKLNQGSCAVVEDTVVYKWARDFYYGDTAKSKPADIKEIKKEEKIEAETKPVTVVKAKKDKKEKMSEEDELAMFDMCLFSDLPENERGSNNA